MPGADVLEHGEESDSSHIALILSALAHKRVFYSTGGSHTGLSLLSKLYLNFKATEKDT